MLDLSAAKAAFETAGLKVKTDGETLSVSLGPALRRRTATFSLDALREAAGDGDSASIASVTRGVYAALNSPLRRLNEEPISFIDAAAVISPSLESGRFAAGVALTGGRAPYLLPFIDGMDRVYLIERDMGYHLLNMDDIARWGVHPERIEKAAASILYHRTGYWRPPETVTVGGVDVTTYKIGDGFDAARATILEELDFHRWREGFFFAVPDSDTLWIAERAADVAALQAAVIAAFAEADAPLSTAVYQVADRQITRLD